MVGIATRTPVALLSAAAAGITLASLPVASEAASPCYPKASKTLLKTERFRVFYDRDRKRWYGCEFKSGLRTTLYTVASRIAGEVVFGGDLSTSTLRIAGDFVGYSTSFCELDVGACAASVRVRNLAKSRKVGDVLAAPDETSEEGAAVTDLELRSNGSVAWIADPEEDPIEVRKLERGKKAERLDQGNDINRRSLKLSGSSLSWEKAGARVTVTLR